MARNENDPLGVTWGETRMGVTWFESQRQALIWMVAVLAAAVLTISAVAPAVAGGGKKTAWKAPGGLIGSEIADDIGALDLWKDGYDGTGIDVAVVDTGVSPVLGLAAAGKVIDGPDFSFDSADADLRHLDMFGHGTAMASLVAGSVPPGTDPVRESVAVGMAPGARIVNLKVGNAVGAVDVSQVIAAIDWAVQNRNANGMNIRVLLLAYDTDAVQPYEIDPLSYAVQNAWFHGITVVVAAGNDGKGAQQLGNPASNPYVLAVGAVQESNNGYKTPSWASSGDGTRNPDVVAPGEDVLAAAVPGSYLADSYPDAVFETPFTENLPGGPAAMPIIRGNGTSQASAVVAGAVALLLDARPTLTPDEVKAALTRSAVHIGSSQEKFQGHGMIDLEAALGQDISLSAQTFVPGSGLGSLDAARGSYYVGVDGDLLTGEYTVFGDAWDPAMWTTTTTTGTSWTDQSWSGGTWSGGTWSGGTWSGGTWSGDSWSGGTWSGGTWSGGTWSGGTWSGTTWSGGTWSGGTWSGGTWSGGTWSGGTWSGGTWG